MTTTEMVAVFGDCANAGTASAAIRRASRTRRERRIDLLLTVMTTFDF
jgi:hypothetical protein